MEGEQTWPTYEELEEADKANVITRMKKVPKGTSDYQAAWIVDNDVEEEDLEEGDSSDEDMDEVDAEEEEESEEEGGEEEPNYDTESVAMTEDMDYDTKHVNSAAEVDELEKLKAARLEAMFPDEVMNHSEHQSDHAEHSIESHPHSTFRLIPPWMWRLG